MVAGDDSTPLRTQDPQPLEASLLVPSDIALRMESSTSSREAGAFAAGTDSLHLAVTQT